MNVLPLAILSVGHPFRGTIPYPTLATQQAIINMVNTPRKAQLKQPLLTGKRRVKVEEAV